MAQTVKTTDGSLTLFSDQYQETYHSIHGAETESRHIFLEASGTADRLRSRQSTHVLEIGFGLGLNCLLTADLAAQYKTQLTFTSVENDLLSAEDLRELNYQHILKTPEVANQLVSALANYQLLKSGALSIPSLHIELSNDIALGLLLVDGSKMQFPIAQYDAIYLDAFSPDTNPECWSFAFFTALHASLRNTGILTTYSSKGVVRRRLQEVGFTVQKHPGPPGKREFLVAHAATDP
jgi:tRNA U34 5-methylaminomethyl-2-thiouridine-forming methyltransferase MnmC